MEVTAPYAIGVFKKQVCSQWQEGWHLDLCLLVLPSSHKDVDRHLSGHTDYT
jgi:hypothetical protein